MEAIEQAILEAIQIINPDMPKPVLERIAFKLQNKYGLNSQTRLEYFSVGKLPPRPAGASEKQISIETAMIEWMDVVYSTSVAFDIDTNTLYIKRPLPHHER